MNMQYLKKTLAICIALALAAMNGTATAANVSKEIVNARQETQIWTTYALNPHLRDNDIKVSVTDGKATLTGNVEESVDKDLAKQIALGVPGVREVDNEIVVQPDYSAAIPPSARSYSAVIDDATITASIKSKLMWSKYTNSFTTDVDTKAGVVTLRGRADSPAGKELAGHLAMNTHGVTVVKNQLLVESVKPMGGDKAKNTVESVERGITDIWITTKVKSTFLYSSNIESSAITVITSRGVVTLSGKVNNDKERTIVIETASNVRGVKDVHAGRLIF